MHLLQLLAVEVALVAVLVALTRGVVVVLGAAMGALLLLVLALGRRQDRWWLERRLMSRSYRRRRRAGGVTQDGDQRLAALRTLAPGLTVENVTSGDGARVGVARDDAGWYAVAVVSAGTPMGDEPGGLPLDALAAALADIDQPGAILQVVTQTVPAPGMEMHLSSPAGHSYRQLLSGFVGMPIPADRSTWISVRLDARSLAEAVADRWVDLENAPALVAAMVRRVAKSLRRAGISHRLLDADALLAVLARSCDLEPLAGQPGPAPREEWSTWHSARLAHRCYWIRTWPPVDQVGALLQGLVAAPAAVTTLAMILAPDTEADMVDLRGLVRISAPAAELDQICDYVARGVRQARGELFQLDGEQGPAVYASAPTGGGAR